MRIVPQTDMCYNGIVTVLSIYYLRFLSIALCLKSVEGQ